MSIDDDEDEDEEESINSDDDSVDQGDEMRNSDSDSEVWKDEKGFGKDVNDSFESEKNPFHFDVSCDEFSRGTADSSEDDDWSEKDSVICFPAVLKMTEDMEVELDDRSEYQNMVVSGESPYLSMLIFSEAQMMPNMKTFICSHPDLSDAFLMLLVSVCPQLERLVVSDASLDALAKGCLKIESLDISGDSVMKWTGDGVIADFMCSNQAAVCLFNFFY
eukprot:gene35706-44034_t